MTQDNKDKPEKTPIWENLEEQFQQLGSDQKVPEDLKEEVFGTLDSLNLFGDVLDLFTTKFSKSEANLIDLVSNPTDKNETETESEEEDKPEDNNQPNQKPPKEE